MQEAPLSIKTFALFLICSIIISMVIFLYRLNGTDTLIVFCDVGQGDGIYIRLDNRVDVIIDAGNDTKILRCLHDNMPFFDRTIEMAMLSHPDHDHYGGFIEILKRYKIGNFFMPPIDKNAISFQQLIKMIRTEKIPIYFPVSTNKINLPSSNVDIFWPTESFIHGNVVGYSTGNGTFSLGKSPVATNIFSIICIFYIHGRSILFTGDTDPSVLDKISEDNRFLNVRHVDILKVPHHGSKNGITRKFLLLADPTLSVISVGKNNRYHHPSPQTLDLFQATNKHYLRTDEKGSIKFVIKSDGELREVN